MTKNIQGPIIGKLEGSEKAIMAEIQPIQTERSGQRTVIGFPNEQQIQTDETSSENRLNANKHTARAGLPFINLNMLIDSTPPPVRWIIKEFLPRDLLGLLVSPGGTGKTFLLLDLAVSVATAGYFLGDKKWCSEVPGKVLCVLGEETEDEIHRRISKILKEKNLSDEGKRLLKENLTLVSAHGINPALISFKTFRDGDNEDGSEFFETLMKDVKQKKYDLIILDPLSRFFKADENDSRHATMFVETLEKLKRANDNDLEHKGTSILVAHHSNKGALKGENNQGSARGSSAFVDGSRWVVTLQRMNDDHICKDKGLKKVVMKERPYWIKMESVKANYLAPGAINCWLKVCDVPGRSGVLHKDNPCTKYDRYADFNEGQL